MTWYADLTPSRHWLHPSRWSPGGPPEPLPEALYRWGIGDGASEPGFADTEVNVGWLSSKYPFPRGDVPQSFLDPLWEACRTQRYAPTRGFHTCELCEQGEDDPWFVHQLGSAEIRIQGAGMVYAAPNLIVHYVAAHHYRPPDGFIEGVIRSGGACPPGIPGKKRPIPEDLLAGVAVDLGALRDAIQLDLARPYGGHPNDKDITHLIIESCEGAVRVSAGFNNQSMVEPAHEVPRTELRHWHFSRSALLNLEQATLGVSSMLQGAWSEWAYTDEFWSRMNAGRAPRRSQ